MKKIGSLVALPLCLALVFALFSCRGRKKEAAAGGSTEQQTAPAQPKSETEVLTQSGKKLYRCPMHPNYYSDKPGNCPICGMKLVPVEKEEKHAAPPPPQKKTMYRSTMNPNEISDKPGKDSMGMEMVPFEVE